MAPARSRQDAHRNRHLERELGPAADRPAAAWLKEASRTSSACRKSNAWTRSSRGEAFEALGYNVVTHGQKTFNGVALLSKRRWTRSRRGLPGDDEDEHARYIEGVVTLNAACCASPASICPTATRSGPRNIAYKLAWMDAAACVRQRAAEAEEPLILAGDYNVIPSPGRP